MAYKRPDEALTISTIPLELTHRILTFCRPRDVAVFSRTCRMAYQLAQDDYLWQRLWHAYPFDDPQFILTQRRAVKLPTDLAVHAEVGKWRAELTRRMKAEFVATMKWKDLTRVSAKDKKDALDILISAVSMALPALDDMPSSANMRWLDTVLRKSELVMSTTNDLDCSPEILQRLAHLRSCMDPAWANRTLHQKAVRRNESRAFVYDLRNYSYGNDFGPFDLSGGVNWIHVEHLIDVILANIRDLPSYLAPPLELESLRAYTAPGQHSPQDWAGVQGGVHWYPLSTTPLLKSALGTWRRYVCFMDYRDLLAFNVSDNQRSEEDDLRHPNFFEDPRFREATRLIEVKLHVVRQADIRFFPSSELLPSASLQHPLIFFSGLSRGNNGNEAVVEGFVRMANDGTTRWKLISIYDHSPQWSFHGVQIGDTCSAKGIIGVWTTTTHEIGDPAGPSWLWKAAEDCSEYLIDYI